jgi:large subunit ribosomal protein L33
MAKKREQIKLKSTESDDIRYTTKNKTRTPGRLELKKFDKKLRRHVIFKESK